MLQIIRLKARLGKPSIANLRSAEPPAQFVGLPRLAAGRCVEGCAACREICPTAAILAEPLRIDLRRCVFCRDCERACPAKSISFGPFHRLAATLPEALVVGEVAAAPEEQEKDYLKTAIAPRRDLRRLLGRSLKLRQVSAGGCNACEMAMNACSNVNFDMGRFGIEWVASPRHADGIVVTGPLSANMAEALEDAYEAVPEPKLLVAAGTCALSGGVFAASPKLDRTFLDRVTVDLYVPGCPPHPLTFIDGLLGLIGKRGLPRQ